MFRLERKRYNARGISTEIASFEFVHGLSVSCKSFNFSQYSCFLAELQILAGIGRDDWRRMNCRMAKDELKNGEG